MRISTAAARSAPTTVTLMTTAWVLGTLAALWSWFGIGMEQWANSYTPDPVLTEELRRKAAATELLVAAVAAGGAGLIAVVAYTGRLERMGSVYLLLAVILGVLALPFVVSSYRTLNPPPSPPPAPTTCQDLSGGDTRCPGG